MDKIKELSPSRNNIFGVMVTYHPDDKLRDRIEKIRPQVDKLLIVDNNSSTDCIAMIRRIAKDLNVVVIENDSNLGIAKALNQGFEYIKSLDNRYSWVLTLDQDSYCYSSLIQQLKSAYDDCPFQEEIGIIGTNYQEKTTGRILHKRINEKENWEEVENLPTSGCITSLNVFSEIGDFRSDFFIDYVDTEYCMRLRNGGYRVLISSKIGMVHPLGYYRVSKLHNWLRGNLMITNYPPLRHYYWTRNGVTLIWENFRRDISWSLNEAYYIFFRRIITVLLFEDKKIIKIRNIALGIWHAVLSRKGIKK
jgi:rhamnosyltransferase